MPALDPEVRRLSAQLAARDRWNPDRDHSELRRQLRVAQTADLVRRHARKLGDVSADEAARLRAALDDEVSS